MTHNAGTVLDRAQGCLVGQAIGDALGAPVEGYKPSSIRRRYGRPRSRVPGNGLARF